MTEFSSKSVRFLGTISLNGPIEEVFPLFSPRGERLWVPGWNPELLHPPATDWAEGLIFRTQEEKGEAIWVMSRLDRAAHRAQYYRVEPGRYVARVEVNCSAPSDRKTEAAVSYEFIGLSDAGNAEIDEMDQESYTLKMARWRGWIDEHLAGSSR